MVTPSKLFCLLLKELSKWKGSKLLPFRVDPFSNLGSKFFPYRLDPFSEGTWSAEMQTESYKNVFLYYERCFCPQIYEGLIRQIKQIKILIYLLSYFNLHYHKDVNNTILYVFDYHDYENVPI